MSLIDMLKLLAANGSIGVRRIEMDERGNIINEETISLDDLLGGTTASEGPKVTLLEASGMPEHMVTDLIKKGGQEAYTSLRINAELAPNDVGTFLLFTGSLMRLIATVRTMMFDWGGESHEHFEEALRQTLLETTPEACEARRKPKEQASEGLDGLKPQV